MVDDEHAEHAENRDCDRNLQRRTSREQISCMRIVRTSAIARQNAELPSEYQNVKIEPSEPSQAGMAERAIDTATDVSRTLTEVSAALQAAVGRLQRHDHSRTATGNAARYRQRDYPRSAAGQSVRRLSVRSRDCAPPLARLLRTCLSSIFSGGRYDAAGDLAHVLTRHW